MCDEEVAALVVDNGSGMCKVNFKLLSKKYCKFFKNLSLNWHNLNFLS